MPVFVKKKYWALVVPNSHVVGYYEDLTAMFPLTPHFFLYSDPSSLGRWPQGIQSLDGEFEGRNQTTKESNSRFLSFKTQHWYGQTFAKLVFYFISGPEDMRNSGLQGQKLDKRATESPVSGYSLRWGSVWCSKKQAETKYRSLQFSDPQAHLRVWPWIRDIPSW